MSQHYFKTMHDGRPIEVLMGWDKPMQNFFLVIERLDLDDDAEDDDAFLYSNLHDPKATRCKDMQYFVDVLAGLGIPVPKAMIDNVSQDGTNNMGNRVVTY